jgi:predicted alpha/beta hydrolase family esterase
MSTITAKVSIGVLLVALGGGAVVVIAQNGRSFKTTATQPPGISLIAPAASVHTADWYVAHPTVAKEDEERCGDDAASISSAACQNVESAEQELLANEMKSAAAANGSAGSSMNPKTP